MNRNGLTDNFMSTPEQQLEALLRRKDELRRLEEEQQLLRLQLDLDRKEMQKLQKQMDEKKQFDGFIRNRNSVIMRYLEQRVTQCSYNCQLKELDHWPYNIIIEIIDFVSGTKLHSLHFDIAVPQDRIYRDDNGRIQTWCFAELMICKKDENNKEHYYRRREFGLSDEKDYEDQVFDIDNLKELDLILAKFDSWYGSNLD